MKVLVDPYMFLLDKESEIKSSIPFFETLIRLCTDKRIQIYLYNELYKRIANRELQPFPVPIAGITDQRLKELVLQLNYSFNNIVLTNIHCLDIETCAGTQDYYVSSNDEAVTNALNNDSTYSDMLFILLCPCYDRNAKSLSRNIVTQGVEKGRKIGEIFSIKCSCAAANSFEKEYEFVSIESLESPHDCAFRTLMKYRNEGKLKFVSDPEFERGDHHNIVQQGRLPHTYSGLNTRNKRVLSVLRYFGLYKVIFERGYDDTSEVYGTILLKRVDVNLTNSIIKGVIFLDNDKANEISLYFPPEIGSLLKTYFNEKIEDLPIKELKERLLL